MAFKAAKMSEQMMAKPVLVLRNWTTPQELSNKFKFGATVHTQRLKQASYEKSAHH